MKQLYILIIMVMFGCANPDVLVELSITNPSDIDREEVINIEVNDLVGPISVMDEQGTIMHESLDLNDDGKIDQVQLLVALAPNETKAIKLQSVGTAPTFAKLTQAELSHKINGEWKEREYIGGEFKNVKSLSVPSEHTDHSWYVRYEGPGWESDRVGYRFYLDWRNGMDIFGKTTTDMALHKIGQDGFDSYHEMQDWGMDVLKVGKSLGLGAIGRHLNDSLYRFQQTDSVYCEVSKNGLLESGITTNYYGWQTEQDKVTLTSEISILARSRMSQHKIRLSAPMIGFCTGLVINEQEEYIRKSDGAFTLLATYGPNSLNDDELGMAIIVKTADIDQVFDDAHSHVVTFKPQNNLTYYFLAAWEQEPNGIGNLADFKVYLDQELVKLNNPVLSSLK
ncbi:MAG: DUF4861 domain-containing protein [Cyclobacteriaceae bacterium]